MLWVHPAYRKSLEPTSANYDVIARLTPTDQSVEKQGRSTGRYHIRTDCGVVGVYLKKYLRIPWWRRWLLPLDRFPGPRELANLRLAAALGIRVAEPMVAGADRRHPCGSLLATRELVGYVPLHEFIPARFAGADRGGQQSLRRHLVQQIAHIARRLHTAALYHRDFYLCHFFIRENPTASPPFVLVLIDLGRLKHSRRRRWRVKDLAQLLYSSELPNIRRTDRLRFYKNYLGLKRLDRHSRRLLRHIECKAAIYRRHNAKAARSWKPRPAA